MDEIKNVEFHVLKDEMRIRFLSDEDLIEFGNPDTADWFVQEVESHADESQIRIVFDFSRLTRINSALLGLIVLIHKSVMDAPVAVGVEGANPSIKKVMELTRLSHLILDE